MRKFVARWCVIITILAALVQCATISAPKGGPKDSLPPVFMGSNPPVFSSSFKGKRITLAFNEFIQLKDQQKLFFTSPPMKLKPTLTPKGKLLLIDFEEPLDSATTYILDFGGSIADLNEGNQCNSFKYIFSTGDCVDSLVMNGQVIDAFSRDSVLGSFIFYFDSKKLDSTKSKLDSLMLNGNADALFRTDSCGYFIADVLKDKDYRIYALWDKNGNQLYEPGTDYIAFLDEDFNPTKLGGFSMVYDSVRRRWDADTVQVTLELFREDIKKRQVLLGSSRPKENLLKLNFNAPDAIVDTLELENIPESWQIHFWSHKHDSLSVWINPPENMTENLPDTIKAHLVYQRTDSVWNMYPHSQNILFKFKKPKSKFDKQQQAKEKKALRKRFGKKNKRRKKEADIHVDSLALNQAMLQEKLFLDSLRLQDSIKNSAKIKFKVNASGEVIPKDNLVFTFEAPLDTLVEEGIELWHLKQQIKKGKIVEEKRTAKEAGEKMPFRIERDSIDILKWHFKADWVAGEKCSLVIPKGAFHNILKETNDTLMSNFVVASPSKYGTLIITPVSKPKNINPNTRYIFQIIEYKYVNQKSSDKIEQYPVIRQEKNISPYDIVKIEYLKPGEKYRLRIIEDLNGNGEWDTGVLESHKKPEKVRIWHQKNAINNCDLVVKANWTVEMELDYEDLFK